VDSFRSFLGANVSRRFPVFCGVLSLLGCIFLAYVFYLRIEGAEKFRREVERANEQAAHIRANVVLFTEAKVPAGVSFNASLERLGVDSTSASRVVSSAQTVYDLRRVRAGNRLGVGRSVVGELRAVRYQVDPDRMLWVLPEEQGGFRAEIKAIPSTTEIVGVTGTVRDSLFNAVTDAGESPELAMRLADIFGWDLDFYTDPRAGDTFRVVVEKRTYAGGQTAAYGRILAAEYNNDGHAYQAVLFHDATGAAAYYAADGSALQKVFLRSPLKFAAPITSHFSRDRYHPILKIHRPHLGIDYGAPTGTPVQSIGSGSVVFAGRQGGAGNLVHIRHANGYETMYMHLSRILVRPGQRVEQGQRIGLVGMTGLATGPHLDFRILQRGAYRNFEALKLPPAEPVRRKDWSEFVAARDRWMGLMPDANVLQARRTAEAPASSGGSSANGR
jgi:murein DD-endopeptidase MepM/ murein hydrolase activator NlpD